MTPEEFSRRIERVAGLLHELRPGEAQAVLLIALVERLIAERGGCVDDLIQDATTELTLRLIDLTGHDGERVAFAVDGFVTAHVRPAVPTLTEVAEAIRAAQGGEPEAPRGPTPDNDVAEPAC